uniref:hypothetical protein n=1 Tax=Thaumasiovibrio occultus TaxID=1891184 RepID=UPI000B356D13|nr:hypothetical protein [Thaumasiovibrio occultus]
MTIDNEMDNIYYKHTWTLIDPQHQLVTRNYYEAVINGVTERQVIEEDGSLYWSTSSAEKCADFPFTEKPEFTPADVEALREHAGLTEVTQAQFDALWHESGATEAMG